MDDEALMAKNNAIMRDINAQPGVLVNGFSILETPIGSVRLSLSEAIAPGLPDSIRFTAVMTMKAFDDFLEGAADWRRRYREAKSGERSDAHD